MSYVDGFVLAVPAGNKDAYKAHATNAASLFREFGTARMVETWGDDVPDGKVNDFKGAVQAKEDEVVVFSWMEYPDKATRDAAGQKMMTDERMKAMADMPCDGKRMIYGGFEPILDIGEGRGSYVDGYVLPVPTANRQAYLDMASTVNPIFLEHGALRVVETWGHEVPTGEVTDFFRAAHAQEGETVVFSWAEWPSKEVRDGAWKAIMSDERMKPPAEPPFDGKRMIYGGFQTLVDA